jgi:hypothetical protein
MLLSHILETEWWHDFGTNSAVKLLRTEYSLLNLD